MIKRIIFILSIFLSLCGYDALASHIVGGDFSYTFIRDTVISGTVFQKYRVTLYIYQDCVTGVPDAINQDNPAFFTVYEDNGSSKPVFADTSIFYDTNPASGGAITVPANFSNECINKAPELCLLRKKFERIYYFAKNSSGYVVVYQRCCRNSSIINIIAPGDEGATYYCTIPPYHNSSAVFKNYPPQIICLNNPLYYDNSATDADGDSLTYEFCAAHVGATDADIKPIVASPPPFDTVSYFPPYSFSNPISGFPPVEIDPETGIITGTPNRIGRYLVTVCCHEWRDGIMVNTTKREFQFVVTDCSKKVIADIPIYSNAPNTYIVNCTDNKVHFVNTSTGGFAYKWTFDLTGHPGINSTDFEPDYVYPDTGTYVVKLVVNPGSTCPDSITRYVRIYPVFKTSFTDTGVYCPGAAITFKDKTVSTIKPIHYWKWDFGDGTTSTDQNPVHSFKTGDTYNVVLASENAKSCADTSLRRIVVQNFQPYAGDDTIIVKGEYIQFDAKGGTKYSWIPQQNLSDSAISNPRAIYPDTGMYSYRVFVQSDYGCKGYDTINVMVVNEASFVVPNAFTPNRDGLNDIFRPRAVGYRSVKYFKVFNRWGQEVYFGRTLETGWDGTWGGKDAELGVYFWEISFTDRFGKDGFLQGDVTLLR